MQKKTAMTAKYIMFNASLSISHFVLFGYINIILEIDLSRAIRFIGSDLILQWLDKSLVFENITVNNIIVYGIITIL